MAGRGAPRQEEMVTGWAWSAERQSDLPRTEGVASFPRGFRKRQWLGAHKEKLSRRRPHSLGGCCASGKL